MEAMHVSVAICTWNRARLLDATLVQFLQLRIPPAVTWELLVVNNQCTDDTDDVVRKYARKLPIKSLHETKQGLSHARNCAVVHASGELLLWTDDDVLVEPQWLTAYCDAVQQWPDADFFGGPVFPWLESPIPGWMQPVWPEVAQMLAIREDEEDRFPLEDSVIPVGANMACRMEIAKRFPFDVNWGRSKDLQVGGEETLWYQQLRAAGHRGAWVGNAKLQHFLPTSRLTKNYLADWFRGAGTALARQQVSIELRRWHGYPTWAIRKMIASSVKQRACLPASGVSWFEAFASTARMKGYLNESKRLYLERMQHEMIVESKES